jgi:hypothetical protein
MNYTALLKIEPTAINWLKPALALPEIELGQLPAKLSQRLWVSPEEFIGSHLRPWFWRRWALKVSDAGDRPCPNHPTPGSETRV